MGQNKYDEAEHIMGNCFVALIALSVILVVVFMISGSKLLVLLGASPKTLPYALRFLRIYLCGTVFVQLTIGMNPFITTQGFARISMFTVLIGAVINIILDPIFIFALHMGVQGAAFANVLSQSVSAIWIMQFLFGKKTKLRIRKKKHEDPKKHYRPGSSFGDISVCDAEYREPFKYCV